MRGRIEGMLLRFVLYDFFFKEYTLAPQRVEYEHDADVEAAIEEFQRSMNEERVQLVASKKRFVVFGVDVLFSLFGLFYLHS